MQCRSRSFFNLKPVSVIVYQFQTVRFIQMMSLTFGLFTQVSSSGPLGPLVFNGNLSEISQLLLSPNNPSYLDHDTAYCRFCLDCSLTHCILVKSSTVICWMSPFVILGVLGLFYCFLAHLSRRLRGGAYSIGRLGRSSVNNVKRLL